MSEQLEKVLVSIGVDLAELKKGLEQGKSQTEAFKRSIEANTRASAEAFDRLDASVKQSVAKQGASIETIKASYVKMAAAATASFLAIRKAWNMAEAAASLEEQRGALEILGRQYGQTADQITKAVADASGAQLDLREATDLATKALQAGFSPQQVAKLVQGAEMIADRTGETIPDAFNKLARAVKTGQERTIAMYFSNLKLTSSLEGEEDAIGATTVQGENYLRVADQIDDMQRQLAGSTESTADAMAQFRVQMSNAGITVDNIALKGMAALAIAVDSVAASVTALTLKFAQLMRVATGVGESVTFGSWSKWFRGQSNEIDAFQNSLGKSGRSAMGRIDLEWDVLFGGAQSGAPKGRRGVVPTPAPSDVQSDFMQRLGIRARSKSTGGGGGRTSSAASSTDKVGEYLADLRTGAAEVGMTEYEIGLSRVISRLQELGATEAQIAQGKAIFAAGFEKKKILEEMGDAAEYAKKATSELAESFVELEGKYGMIAAETEAARAEYQKEAIGSLGGIFGDLDQQFGMNPRDTESARNDQIASLRKESEAIISNLTPYLSYIKQMERLDGLRKQGIIDTHQYYLMEQNASDILRTQEQNVSQFNGTIEERTNLENMLRYAVGANILTAEDATNAMANYDQAIGRLEASTPKAITQIGQLSEGFGKALSDWQESFDVTKDIQRTVGDFANGITDSFFAMIQSGQDFGTSMSGVLKTILADIASMVFQISIVQPLMSGITGALSGAGAISLPAGYDKAGLAGYDKAGLGANSLKGFASGGFTKASMPIVVGEEGPEIFVPGASGTIIPNDQLAGAAGQSVNVTLNVPAGVSRAELMQILPAYKKATMAAIADANQRGGSFSAALG